MRYRLRHYTHYNYAEAVDQAHNQVRMMLRDVPHQRCIERGIRVRPGPRYAKMHIDYFGNRVLYFEIDREHRDARIFATHIVEVNRPPGPPPEQTAAWEHVAARLHGLDDEQARSLQMYRLPSQLVSMPEGIAELSQPHFSTGRPILEAVQALSKSIFENFKFNPKATTIATPVADVLKQRQGVCQDFAHLMIAALRQRGLAARYVSGYIETLPPPGKPRLVGADASHAWVSVWCGDDGWLDIDPTNNLTPGENHITTAWGRDYDDVIPLNGVIFGGGDESSLTVRVDVERLPPAAS